MKYNKKAVLYATAIASLVSANPVLAKAGSKNPKDIVSTYVNYLDEVDIHYNYEKIYPKKKEMLEFVSDSYCQKGCDYDYEMNHIYSAVNELIDVIFQNNVTYLRDYPEYDNVLNDENVREDLKEVLENYFNNATHDILEDYCLMHSLKILSIDMNGGIYDNPVYSIYDDDANIICLDMAAIEASSDKKVLYENLAHNLELVGMKACNCRIDKGQKVNDVSILSENSFYLDSAAESIHCNLYYDEKSNNLRNYPERQKECMLLLMGMFDNHEMVDYYNALKNSNMKNFLSFFDAESEEEILEFFRIVYSIDGSFGRNGLGADGQFTSSNLDKVADKVGYDYKTAIFKKVLSQLAEYTLEEKDFSLEENLMMFDITKNVLMADIYDKNSNKMTEADKKGYFRFLNQFTILESNYVKFLSNYYRSDLKKRFSFSNDSSLDDFAYEVREIEREVSHTLVKYINGTLVSNESKIMDKILNRFPIVYQITSLMVNDSYDLFLKKNGKVKKYTRNS